MPKVLEPPAGGNAKTRFFIARQHRDYATPPGPSHPIPFTELNRARKAGLIRYLQGLVREHGNVVCARFGPAWIYFINEPELIRDILQRQYKSFTKGYAGDVAKEVMGKGVFFAEGDQHRRQRKLMQPAFHKECLRRYSEHMLDCLDRVNNTLSEGRTVDIAKSMNSMTMDVVVSCLFGTQIENDSKVIGDSLSVIFEIAVDHLMSPLGMYSLYLPTTTTRRYKNAIAQLDRVVKRMLEEHQRDDTVFDDLMDIMMLAKDEDGSSLTLKQLRDETMTLFVAGHETTAITLSWAWYEIARNPEFQARLQCEVDEVLQGRRPTFEDVPKLTYCRKLMQESLRYYPPVYIFFRQAREEVVVGDYTLPEGAHVLLSPYITQRDPRFFPNPDQFNPDRWTPEFEAQLPKMAFFPFSGGPRVCLGEHFAWMEGILALAYLAQRWHFSLSPHQSIGYGNSATLRPEPGIDVRLHARNTSIPNHDGATSETLPHI